MRALILSGGSEIVATALADEFLETGIPFSVISLGKQSLFKSKSNKIQFAELDWPVDSPEQSIAELKRILKAWGVTSDDPWVAFPTEDGGLRLLLEYGEPLRDLIKFSRSKLLKWGGLDKAELFSHLWDHGCGDIIANTRVAVAPEEIIPALKALGGDCVIKPSLKPLSMRLEGMRAKAFISGHYADMSTLLADVENAWPISRKWIVQSRLDTPPAGEAVFWAVRDAAGKVSGIAARERWKQPRAGGTGCWVTTDVALAEHLRPLAESILAALDFRGLCELAFLVDAEDHWRLLELNPRPWLQVGLAHKAGACLATHAVFALRNRQKTPSMARDGISWVNIERIMLAALSGDYGPRLQAMKTAYQACKQADTHAIYSSGMPCIQRRWLGKMFIRAASRIFRP
jgi:predicted ATP-grasp superfamily ATP-dependent carboligase